MKMETLRRGVVGGILALLLVGITFPTPKAAAATEAELQAQIQTLLTQLITLQNQLQAMLGGTAACVVPQANLTYGDRGSDVTALQNFLINHGYIIPAGPTGYFGEQTREALRQFQATEGIGPALGYNYGPLTRARVTHLCNIAPTPTPTPTPEPEPEPILSGEAYITDFTVKDGEDTDLEEGDDNIEVMNISFEVTDGDLELNRFSLGVTPDPANDEKDPWDTFGDISVWRGSKKLAEIDGSRRNNWSEDRPDDGDYLIRMSGLDYIIRENRDVELTVEVSVQNSVRGTDDGEIWNIFVPDEGIRALDADHAAVYAGDTADAVTLNLDRAGASDEIIVRRSDEDPDAGTIQVESDGHSGYVTVFAFDLDTDDSSHDITIYELPIELTVSSGTLETFMRDIRLTVDGETYTHETTVDGATGIVTFDFDRGDLVIDAGDRVTAEVEVDFRSLPDSYEGVTIVGHVDADNIDAEGSDDLVGNQLEGAATGELHTLYTKGSDVEKGETSAVVTTVSGNNNDYATFKIKVNLTAFGQDVYIPVGSSGVTYQLQDSVGNVLGSSGTSFVSSSADEVGSYFFIPEGETESLTLNITYLPGIQNTTARAQLTSINFNDTAAAPDQSWTAVPLSSYRTPAVIIVN